MINTLDGRKYWAYKAEAHTTATRSRSMVVAVEYGLPSGVINLVAIFDAAATAAVCCKCRAAVVVVAIQRLKSGYKFPYMERTSRPR